MLHRRANMLIINYDCCLPHLKTEGNESEMLGSLCQCHGKELAVTAPTLPTEKKKESPTTDSCFDGFTNFRRKHELKINWEPRWNKVSRVWKAVKLHYDTLCYPRHLGTVFLFFFFHAEGYLGRGPSPVAHRKSVVLPIIRCCNGLWPRRNTREKGKLHAQLA